MARPPQRQKQQPHSSTDLTIPGGSTEVALPETLIESAKVFARGSRSPNTLNVYRRCCNHFEKWCNAHGRAFLPAHPHTLAAYATWMAEGRGGQRKPHAMNYITLQMSAIQYAHRKAGHRLDMESNVVMETLAGIRRKLAETQTLKQAKALTVDHLRTIIDALKPDNLRDIRDASLLSLGWAGALRRSEIGSLDWEKLGSGKGFVTLGDEGITITLMTSKASQSQAETIAIPRIDMPSACTALEAWVTAAKIEPGTPLYRRIWFPSQTPGKDRLDKQNQAISRIVKSRIVMLEKLDGKKLSKAERAALKGMFSGHSMRAGFATSAARRGVPGYKLQGHMRHKSSEMTNKYIREANKFTHSALKGVGI